MSLDSKGNAKDIFLQAIDVDSHEERAAFLADACGDDPRLRGRVDALIIAHERPESLLNRAAPEMSADDIEPTVAAKKTEKAGTQIGPYKLLQQIGEGGMGTVYMAEQVHPVRRKVALKVIKPGMDSDAVVARFEAERQALAMMDHPNIARVFDGGVTDEGRPFFVMELVKGVPITEYCDKNELSTEQRLKLFATVCQAVQHAHQKGIIHRDIKPSNVLVTLADGEPVGKVIDFGVAKATNQQLTEKTLFTAFGQMVGTPQYMSPEQAEMSCLDVDTRSDVYSLGVLLYELLTGTTPLEAERLRSAGYAEMQRLIREEEPPKPSTRLSTSKEHLTIVAKHRSLSPDQLQKAVRGDLDWIAMKALEKDRARRYETPASLAEDVRRFLEDEPVEACPPTSAYRARKFVRRNRALLAVVTTVGIVLVAATLISSWFAIHMNEARRDAEAQRSIAIEEKQNAQKERQKALHTLGELKEALKREAVEYAFSGDVEKLDTAMSKATAAGAEEFWAKRLRAVAALLSGNYEEAEQLSLECRSSGDDSAAIHGLLTEVYLMKGKLPEAWISLGKAMNLPKEDFEDSLFYAFASYVDPVAAMQAADRLFSDHKSPLAFLLWSRARFYLAEYSWDPEQFSWDPEQADQAVEDGRIARKFFDNSPHISFHQLTMLSELVKFAELKKDEARIEKYTAEGESVVEMLESSGQPGAILSNVGYFLETIGKDVEAEQIYLKAITDGNYWAINDYSAFLLERGRYADAVARLRDAAKTSIPMKLRYAIALGEIPGRQKEAIEILQSIARDPQSGLGYQNAALHHLAFLGRQDLAFELADDIAETSSQQTAPTYLNSMVDVWTENLDTPEAILEKTNSPNERWQTHESLCAYYFAKGDFEKAERHLKKANAFPRSRLSDRTHLIWMRKINEAVAGQ